jgi:hypothetical protein
MILFGRLYGRQSLHSFGGFIGHINQLFSTINSSRTESNLWASTGRLLEEQTGEYRHPYFHSYRHLSRRIPGFIKRTQRVCSTRWRCAAGGVSNPKRQAVYEGT